MLYVIHLALPAVAALVMVALGHMEWSFDALGKLVESFGALYIFLALPHWLWGSATSYFEISVASTVGGFFGAHVALVAVAIFVAASASPEAANGWFLYIFGAPVAVVLGALIGRGVSQWRVKSAA